MLSGGDRNSAWTDTEIQIYPDKAFVGWNSLVLIKNSREPCGLTKFRLPWVVCPWQPILINKESWSQFKPKGGEREREREWKQHPPDWIKSLSNTHLGTHFLLAPNNWKVLNSLTTGFITCPLAWAATRAHCELKDPSQELCWTAQREHEVHGLSLGESEAPWEMAGRLCLGWRSVSWHVEMVLWGHGTVALGMT